MRFIIKQLKARKRWRCEYRLNGIRHRPVFKTKELAEAEKERVEQQVKDGGTAWLALKPNERTALMTVFREIQSAGKTLREVWEEYKRRVLSKKLTNKQIGAAFEQFKAECGKLHLSKRHIGSIQSNIGRFVSPRSTQALSSVTRQDLIDFLEPHKDETFNTYRRYLNIFFNWCVRLRFIEDNPVASIEAINKRRMAKFDKPPHVLHYEDCVKLLKSTLENDPGLIRFTATCLQAGLRPEREAPQLRPGDIGEKIHVRGRTAKDRQQRYIEIVPALKEWLALPLGNQPGDKDGPLPPLQGPSVGDWPIKNLRKRFEAVRAKAGLIKIEIKTRPKKKGDGVVKVGQKITDAGWGQDCMRHTFASAYFAVYGAEKTIEALGHGDYDMLFGHYRKLMTKEEGGKILSITPDICLGIKKPAHEKIPRTRTATSSSAAVAHTAVQVSNTAIVQAGPA